MKQVVTEGNMSTWQFFYFFRVHPQGEIERGRKGKVGPPARVTDERGGADERHFPHVLECLLAQHRPWQEENSSRRQQGRTQRAEEEKGREKESERVVRGCLSQALTQFPAEDEIRQSVVFPLVKGALSQPPSQSRSDAELSHPTHVVSKRRIRSDQIRSLMQIQVSKFNQDLFPPPCFSVH